MPIARYVSRSRMRYRGAWSHGKARCDVAASCPHSILAKRLECCADRLSPPLISLVDADSYWIDGYFEETSLGRIQDGDPATVKLMGYRQLVRGHVGGVARGINIPNAQPDPAGLASVNPIFTWVRLAQRIPVRIHIDQVPDGVRLVAGMTGTVQIDPHPRPPPP